MLSNQVSAENVARYYIVSEMSKIFLTSDFRSTLEESIEKLSAKDLWKLLQALSFTYRLNGVFWRLRTIS